jgi:ATP-dependent Clp protease ATP-binding subunit ClpA
LKALIDAAIAMAQRHRHPEVMVDHVAAAIAEHEAWWRRRIVPVVHPELVRLSDARLAVLAMAGSYRDYLAVPKLSPEADTLFEPSKWLRRDINLPLILKRLDGETPIFREVMSGVHSIGNEVRAAFHVLRARNHAGLQIEHLLWVMSERDWFERALVMAGGDTARFTTALDARLQRFEKGAGEDRLSDALEALIATSRLHEGGGTIDSLLEVALLEDRVKQIFASAGASSTALHDLVTSGALRK